MFLSIAAYMLCCACNKACNDLGKKFNEILKDQTFFNSSKQKGNSMMQPNVWDTFMTS